MAYTKTNWQDNETQLTAAKLNNMEAGIAEANEKAASNEATLAEHNDVLVTLNGVTTEQASKLEALDETTIPRLEEAINQNTGNIQTIGQEMNDIGNWRQHVEQSFENINTSLNTSAAQMAEHISDTNNPHSVTPNQIGAYTVDEIDDRLSPVVTIRSTDLNSHELTLEGMNTSANNLILDVEPSAGALYGDNLWQITEGDWCGSLSYDETTNELVNLVSQGYSIQTINDIDDATVTKASVTKFMSISSEYLSSMDNYGYVLSAPNNYKTLIAFTDDVLRRLYFVPLSSASYYGVVHTDNKLFVQYFYEDILYVIDLPEGLSLYTICFDVGDIDEDEIPDITHNLSYPIFITCDFSVFEGDACVGQLGNIYKPGRYNIEYNSTKSGEDDFSCQFSCPYSAYTDINLSYFKNNSNIGDVLKLEEKSTLTKDDIKTEAQSELQKLINVGTNDPTDGTPGVLYFKYMP